MIIGPVSGFVLRLAASLFELRRHKTPWQISEPYETWLAGSGFAFGFAVTVFVQTRFERKLVGRPGLEPGTTGLKVR